MDIIHRIVELQGIELFFILLKILVHECERRKWIEALRQCVCVIAMKKEYGRSSDKIKSI